LVLDIVLLATRTKPFRRDAPWSNYAAMGLLNNVLPFSLIFCGQTQIASGLASILNATTPLFTLVAAHFLTADEKIDPAKVTALLAGFAGVALLIGPELLVGGALQDDENCTDRGRRRTGHCKYRVDSADHAGRRAALDAAGGALAHGLGGSAAWRCCRRPSPMCFISAFWPPPAPPTCCSSPS
jgi:drug/metabolite transporter (DMT)-like permease